MHPAVCCLFFTLHQHTYDIIVYELLLRFTSCCFFPFFYYFNFFFCIVYTGRGSSIGAPFYGGPLQSGGQGHKEAGGWGAAWVQVQGHRGCDEQVCVTCMDRTHGRIGAGYFLLS